MQLEFSSMIHFRDHQLLKILKKNATITKTYLLLSHIFKLQTNFMFLRSLLFKDFSTIKH